MPDPPPAKRTVHFSSVPRASTVQPAVRYAELHVKTNFSFLEGASHPDELVARAAELNYTALAVTDRDSLAGVVRAHAAAKAAGLKLLIGAEVHPLDAPAVVLLATDRPAYGRLAQLLSLGRRRAPKGQCELRWNDVAEHAHGLLALVCLQDREAELGIASARKPIAGSADNDEHGRQASVAAPAAIHLSPGLSSQEDKSLLISSLARYREAFGDRCYGLVELHRGPDDNQRLAELIERAGQARVPLVAANDVHYHVPARRALADVLLATRLGSTVAAAGPQLSPMPSGI